MNHTLLERAKVFLQAHKNKSNLAPDHNESCSRCGVCDHLYADSSGHYDGAADRVPDWRSIPTQRHAMLPH